MKSVDTVVRDLCNSAGLTTANVDAVDTTEQSACLASSFAIGTAAQASIAAAALGANEIYRARSGARQTVRVPRIAAEMECTGYFQLNGATPNAWDTFSGLYETNDGHVRVHANFAHHRDGALALLGLNAEANDKADVARALRDWSAQDYEDAAAQAGLVVAKVRSFEEWDAHPHALANIDAPVIKISKIGDAPPAPLPTLAPVDRPLSGVRVLDLTRILAGPICGRTLAAYGADVLLINSPNLPNIAHLTDTSRGKRSAHLDLHERCDRAQLEDLVRQTDAFVQGYRPGGLAALGFGPEALAAARPGIVVTSLCAYGTSGPWAGRRGFDSLVQTATGFNHAEAHAFGSATPQALPVQILDFASGFLMAFGTEAALLRRAREGGSWLVEVSLLHTANWLRTLGRTDTTQSQTVSLKKHLQAFGCDTGELLAMPHAADFSATPATWTRASAPPGTHPPSW